MTAAQVNFLSDMRTVLKNKLVETVFVPWETFIGEAILTNRLTETFFVPGIHKL